MSLLQIKQKKVPMFVCVFSGYLMRPLRISQRPADADSLSTRAEQIAFAVGIAERARSASQPRPARPDAPPARRCARRAARSPRRTPGTLRVRSTWPSRPRSHPGGLCLEALVQGVVVVIAWRCTSVGYSRYRCNLARKSPHLGALRPPGGPSGLADATGEALVGLLAR